MKNSVGDSELKKIFIIASSIAACLIMAVTETVIRPGYIVKSAVKAAVFLGALALYAALFKDKSVFDIFKKPTKTALRPAAVLAIAVFSVVLLGYVFFGGFFDFSAVTVSLSQKEGITARLFPFAAVYITFINSLIEELLFRGYIFSALMATGSKRLAWVFSALSFSLYHVFIMDGWFGLPLMLILIIGLFIGGIIFEWLDRDGTVWPSWIVHMAADLAVMAVGLKLFGLI